MTQEVLSMAQREPQFRSVDVGEPLQALSAATPEFRANSRSVYFSASSANSACSAGSKLEAEFNHELDNQSGNTLGTGKGLKILGKHVGGQEAVFSQGALSLLNVLCQQFAADVPELLEQRSHRQMDFDAGKLPDFLPHTESVRLARWQIRGTPTDLQDRRVEITGPVERKMVINALNTNAKVFIADFEDSLAPTWAEIVEGQINLRDAVAGDIAYTDPITAQHYRLNDDPAVLMCRVRGLHLSEKHVEFDGVAIPASLFDFAIYFYNNYRQLLNKGSGPYFYIPKLECYLEARWWAKVFAYVEERFCLQPGTIKCTCLIETLPAILEMEEILFELRSNIVALNCGRWDSISSDTSPLKEHAEHKQPLSFNKAFLSAYSRLLVKVCHKRGALAIGGMAAVIPGKDAELNKTVVHQLCTDKELEARNGHDGTWVAHLDLTDTAMAIFNQYLGTGQKNQLHITRDTDGPIRAEDLLQLCEGR